ncbi:MAG: hypothetical protein ChlgKO_02250 [Chlamydiales bacterium]
MLQAAKLLKTHAIIEEMEALFSALPDFQILQLGRFIENPVIAKKDFLSASKKSLSDPNFASPCFSCAWTSDPEAFVEHTHEDGRKLIQLVAPVLQLRPHRYLVSEGKVHLMVYGKNTTAFGIEFSYPALFSTIEDPRVRKTLHEPLPNNALYKAFASWIRRNTRPQKIEIAGEMVLTTMRK